VSKQSENAPSVPTDWTSSISYQSKATARPTAADLRELVSKAESRNRALGVTGMLLYDKGRFFQTLEGPPRALETLWTSISSDPRHAEIEVLSEHVIPSRLFGGWNLVGYHGDEVLPSTLDRARAEHELSSEVPTFIDLVLNGDDIGINRKIATLIESGWKGAMLLTHLIEPTARALGDAWLSDDCSELDLAIGLSMLQLAGHAISHDPTPAKLRASQYRILLATAPGEPHMLGTSLLADLFTDAGWSVDMAFPDSNQALANQLAAQQPDAVDIGLSDALSRKDSLALLRRTIERSRFAAPDHLTVVSVGGRLFSEAIATAENVGADYARQTVAGASMRLAELIRLKRQDHRPK
jgi:methanogenic corrinoid protein MtbC1